jgi:hypothetical protein
MTGPELDLLEGGGGNADLHAGHLGAGGRLVHAAACENPYERFGRHPIMATGAADYVSLLAVRAQLKGRGVRFTSGASFRRYYRLEVQR